MSDFRNEEYIMPEPKPDDIRARQMADAESAFTAPNPLVWGIVVLVILGLIGSALFGY